MTYITLALKRATTAPAGIQPLPFWKSLMLFGIPALAIAVSFHVGMPALGRLGLTDFESLVVAHTVPMALLFAAAMVAYAHVEGRPLTWAALGERLRFPRLTLKAILWAAAIFAALNVGYGIFAQIGQALIRAGLIPLPASLPAIVDPRVSLSASVIEQMAGGPLQGNWKLVVLYSIMLFFNVAGEELWWRGVILPRQELAHGKFTWLIHGLLWTAFHMFKWWDVIGLLPVCLIIAYCAQRLKNNWPGLIAHTLFNGLVLPVILAGVLGFAR